ncbi:MAG: isocitrate lyase/PEP mutase family protein [Desulfobacterales bacterium]|nr:isocitrate lyase/PEP mutase family protein [Desulfobacterales bacterium]
MPKIEQRRACLRNLLDSGEVIVAPGAYDALTAKLIEQIGFQAAYVTGAGVAVTKLGVPDIGLVAMTEQLETAKNIVNSTQIPIICDIDTGYGNALNLMRTVREFERIGVSAVQVEDQLTPKRCGHIDGKQVVSQDEMLRKIEAFKKARTSKDLF